MQVHGGKCFSIHRSPRKIKFVTQLKLVLLSIRKLDENEINVPENCFFGCNISLS